MRYNIAAPKITGANALGKISGEITGKGPENVEKDEVEKVLRSRSAGGNVYLTATLPIPLEAKVLRNLEPGKEIVRLSSGGRQVDLRRDVAGDPGDIGVSCDPHGDEVSIDTLNIKFRDIADSFTDRGIVWVFPGNPAKVMFVIKAGALKTPGLVTGIVAAAEEAIRTKVIAHLFLVKEI